MTRLFDPPDLPHRLQANVALNPDNTAFYGYGQPDLAGGYTTMAHSERSNE
jgi:hypothetical protein